MMMTVQLLCFLWAALVLELRQLCKKKPTIEYVVNGHWEFLLRYFFPFLVSVY